MNTEENPKHHKYVSVNKVERKKKKVRFEYGTKPKYFLTDSLRCIGNRYYLNGRIQDITYIPKSILSCLPPNCIVLYDDCSHTKFRIYNKKKRMYLYINY